MFLIRFMLIYESYYVIHITLKNIIHIEMSPMNLFAYNIYKVFILKVQKRF